MLLKAHEQAGDFLNSPAAASPTLDLSAAEGPGTIIGPYKLLERIGEGGMGLVYMAEQQQPMRRLVALKIIKPGMDSRQVIARFEAERQALALMDHVNIAKVLDAGTIEFRIADCELQIEGSSRAVIPQSQIRNPPLPGRPYFVMELVMCDWKLGNADEARALLKQAVAWLEMNEETLAKDKAYAEQLRHLLAEAEDLLGEPPPKMNGPAEMN
jgi:hypothetical protein